jgi:glycosyltransferase involved in cell wall biosynthesis
MNKQHKVIPLVYNEQTTCGMRQLYLSSSFIKWVLALPIKIIKNKPHLLITGMFGVETVMTFFVSKLLRKPLVVLDEHWYWQKTLPMRVLWPIAKLVAGTSVLVVSGSLSKKFWGIAGLSSEKIKVLHFDSSLLKPQVKHVLLAEKIKTQFSKKIVLYFGRLIKRKGVDFLIKAFADISKEKKDVVLVIAGKGEERGNLEKLCKDLGLCNQVYFAGFVNEDDKVAYFLACDVFVCPSVTIGMPEIWGIVVNEAVSLGKPVVTTTAVGSSVDLVRHGINGYVVPERNVEALYRAIKIILDSEKLRVSMGKASEKIAEKFTYSLVSKGLGETVESAMKKAVPYVAYSSILNVHKLQSTNSV